MAGLLALLAATDLMYHFPPLFAMLALLDRRTELAGQTLTSSLYRTLLVDPQVMAMVAHVWLAAIAVTGILVMRLAAATRQPSDQTAGPRPYVVLAARWAGRVAGPIARGRVAAAGHTGPQSRSLDGRRRRRIAAVRAGDRRHIWVAASFGRRALGDPAPGQIRRSLLLGLGIVLLMTAALDRTRGRQVDPAGTVTSPRGGIALGEVTMNRETIVIQDSTGGTQARIMPALGFNCYSFQAALGGEPASAGSDPEFAGGEKRPTRSGIPILFPFAGRIGGAKYRYAGRDYQLAPSDELGNAIHGFAVHHPWRVVEQTPDSLTGEFQASVDDPTILDHWPADFCLRADISRFARHAARPGHDPQSRHASAPLWAGVSRLLSPAAGSAGFRRRLPGARAGGRSLGAGRDAPLRPA